jgi:hypothetical protein
LIPATCRVGIGNDGSIYLYAGSDLEPGDEVTITYGAKCNRELSNNYGFEIEGNPRTRCEWDALVGAKLSQSHA